MKEIRRFRRETNCISLSKNSFCMQFQRILRVNELLRKELSRIVLESVELPESVFVTIAQAVSSPDLQHAKIYVTIIPEERSQQALAVLSKNIFEIQQKLNKRLVMRPIPKIEFVLI